MATVSGRIDKSKRPAKVLERPSVLMANNVVVSIPEAAYILGVGRTAVYDMLGRGELESVHVGRRRLVTTSSIRAKLQAVA